jgi:hypothetical protein
MAKREITTSGDLRDYLCMAIKSVGNGSMDVAKANSINKLAGQINESLYSEVKVAKTALELGQTAAEFGRLPLGGEDENGS